MDDTSSSDIIRFGLSSLIKLILLFFVVLIICSVFLITIGWILTMAFSEIKLFEATLIPLLILGFAGLMVGLISIWMRLGDIGYVLDPESGLFDESDLSDPDYFFDEDDVQDNEISSQKNADSITPILKKRKRMRSQHGTETSDDY